MVVRCEGEGKGKHSQGGGGERRDQGRPTATTTRDGDLRGELDACPVFGCFSCGLPCPPYPSLVSAHSFYSSSCSYSCPSTAQRVPPRGSQGIGRAPPSSKHDTSTHSTALYLLNMVSVRVFSRLYCGRWCCVYVCGVVGSLQTSQAAPRSALLLACCLRDRRRLGLKMQLLRAVSICIMSEAGACLW